MSEKKSIKKSVYKKPTITYLGKVSNLTKGGGSQTSDGWMAYTTIVVS